MVLYRPVWRPDDEVPALISEEEFLAQLITSTETGPVNYDEPIIWTPTLSARASAVSIEHINWLTWYLPGAERTATFERGERHVNLDGPLLAHYLNGPILAMDYSFVCPVRCVCDCHKAPMAKL
ncbi:hypothetical protein B0H11DRAFT_2262790 [Mycena galericulata]|nr:hypothetical protein B0H11DRAFT_2262790 [Mycena galericulata]